VERLHLPTQANTMLSASDVVIQDMLLQDAEFDWIIYGIL